MEDKRVSNLESRIEQLENLVAELDRRTSGQMMIGPGLYPEHINPVIKLNDLTNYPPIFSPVSGVLPKDHKTKAQ
jgi:hypothetical protein